MIKHINDIKTINRGCITIVPQKPFYDRVNYLDPENPFSEDDFQEYNTYLIDDDFAPDNLENVVKKRYKIIFENELNDMWTKPEDWPQKRDFRLFKKWFKFYISAVVMDLETKSVFKENF